jgi:uncharacterized membrane protein YccC
MKYDILGAMTSPEVRARAPFWRTVLYFDAAKTLPWQALRNSMGVAIPLAIGVLVGNASAGVVAATGALNVAFSDGSDPYRRRARRMLYAGCFVALAVFAGRLCGHDHLLAAFLAAACAFTAGMMVAIGQTPADIGTITLVTLVVFSAQPTSPGKALSSGLLVFAGALLQTMLAVALWPVRRYSPERRALAAFYAELARGAGAGAATEAPPASTQSIEAHNALTGLADDHSVEGERYLALLSLAERIRLALLALARLRVRIGRESGTQAETEVLNTCLTLASEMLASISNALSAGVKGNPHIGCLKQMGTAAEKLRQPNPSNSSPDLAALRSDARAQLDALAGQLRFALELAAHTTPAGSEEFERQESAQPWGLRLAGVWAVLRANLTLQSPAFRHAVRLAVCVAAADLLARTLGWRRTYWVPMTVAIVLKPDFTTTFSRGLLRLAGTFVGLGFATALFHILSPPIGLQVALIAVFVFLMRWLGPANYGILTTAITTLVVLLFAVSGVTPTEVIAARGMNTVAGGLIALLAYRLWPTWEQTQVAEGVARLLDAYRAYLQAIRDAYLNPSATFTRELDRARQNCRLARSNLEASAARLGTEPGVDPARLTALSSILANSHRLIHAVMSLEAGLYRSRPAPARDAFRTFANHVDVTLYFLAAGLRGARVEPATLPDLREDHHALLDSGDPRTERYALVNIETDRITNSLNTLAGEILAVGRVRVQQAGLRPTPG